jgi:hypothetical protein
MGDGCVYFVREALSLFSNISIPWKCGDAREREKALYSFWNSYIRWRRETGEGAEAKGKRERERERKGNKPHAKKKKETINEKRSEKNMSQY